MSSLGLDRRDIEKAVKQYYSDYEPDLYKQFDFDNFTLYVDNKRIGYTGFDFTVREREQELPKVTTPSPTDKQNSVKDRH